MKMKKIAALAAAGVMACSSASAAIEQFAEFTFEQLVGVQQLITLELMSRPDWKEVTVPAGVYKIGVEIPAGKWHITPVKGQTAHLKYGSKLNATGTDCASGSYIYTPITEKTDSYAKYNSVEFVEWDLQEGMYLVIDGANVVFTRYAGPSFSFN